MIKRPLNPRFREPVLRDEKTTTIRDKPWPVGVPTGALALATGSAFKNHRKNEMA